MVDRPASARERTPLSAARFALAAALGASALTGCGDEESGPARTSPDGGQTATGCVAGERADGAGCVAAGVPSDGCGVGFVSDGAGSCDPVLPAEPCPPGRIAVPGDEACRPVAPCDGGPWGAAPIEPTTQFVDQAYPNGDSDGTEARPWTTVGAGVSAAEPGAVVAITSGSYAENLVLTKPVHLWGRCPDLVELAGATFDAPGLWIETAAGGAEVHDLAVSANGIGVVAEGVAPARLDRIWVHDTTSFGIGIRSDTGPTEVTVVGSLIEQSSSVGVLVLGSSVTLEAVAVRDTTDRGLGIQVETENGALADVTVTGSVLEKNGSNGIFVSGGSLVIDSTAVRDTTGLADAGYGVEAFAVPSADAMVRRSVVERSAVAGIVSTGCPLTVDATVVRDTANAGHFGVGVYAKTGATLALSGSLIDRVHTAGVVVEGSHATVASTRVRDVAPRPDDQAVGAGILFELGADEQVASDGAVRACVVERAHAFGLGVSGSSIAIEATAIRDTRAEAATGFFGDGLFVEAGGNEVELSVTGSRIEASARAGISNFSAHVSLESTVLECNPIALDGEVDVGVPYVYADLGGNACGCAGQAAQCAAVTSNLDPPGGLADPG